MSGATFPGGVGLSELTVYESRALDGRCGGSPHMHLVSTEAYVVSGGRGSLQSIDSGGFRETPLSAGSIVWFTPGTIHRAVNDGGLRMTVMMSNTGLPEAGDAVMTFPPEYLTDARAYAAAASLDGPGGADDRMRRVEERRDLAVRGFLRLRQAMEENRADELADFYRAAGELVRNLSASWRALIEAGPLAQAQRSLELADRVGRGDVGHLEHGSVITAPPVDGDEKYGMCGRLRPRI